MTDTQDSLAELLAEQAAMDEERAVLNRKIEAVQLPALEAIIEAWNKPTVKAAITALDANLMALTDHRQSQAGNMLAIATQSFQFLEAEAARIAAQIEADNPPPEADAETSPA